MGLSQMEGRILRVKVQQKLTSIISDALNKGVWSTLLRRGSCYEFSFQIQLPKATNGEKNGSAEESRPGGKGKISSILTVLF